MKRQLRFIGFLIAATGAALWGSAHTARTQSSGPAYGVTDLGTLGGNMSVATGITRGGFPAIGGYSLTAAGVEHAFSGNPYQLHDLGTLGGATSTARNVGIGVSYTATGAQHAFIDGGNRGLIDLGTLGGTNSSGSAINDSTATAVGYSQIAGDSAWHAFTYSINSATMSDLGASLGGTNSWATAINTNNHVAGYADVGGTTVHHAFLFSGGVTQDLGSFGGWSEAWAVNDTDVVVGKASVNGFQHAFAYAGGSMQDLGTLGGSSSAALGVSNNGTIVGWAEDGSGTQRAVMWQNGVIQDLNNLIPSGTGWTLVAATAIQVQGSAIVGYGIINGLQHAFMLTPPNDIHVSLTVHQNDLSTNFPNPIEAGQPLTVGATIYSNGPYSATDVVVTQTMTGPVQIVSWYGADSCAVSNLTVTCKVRSVDFARDVMINIKTTAAGTFTHSAAITADQPDPNPSNNSASESNLAVSLASLTLAQASVTAGQQVLSRATITAPAPTGDARVTLTSSNPSVASVPSPFDVLAGCCDNGTWREFYVTTYAVSAPTTVQISATYGLVTITVPLTVVPAGTLYPYTGSPSPVPGRIEAENFDDGGEGVAYHDLDSSNNGGAYRNTGVDIESTTDTGGGYDVGWIAATEWLKYTVNVATAGTYRLDARVASPGQGGTFHVEMDGTNVSGTLAVPDTGGWQAWTTVSASVTLTAGTHVLRVSFDSNGATGAFGNLNWIQLTATSPPGGSTPYGGTPRAIPGLVQAEDFDNGGEGVAYHDTTPGNSGGQYRSTDVDIEGTPDTGGGYDVGWIQASEWLNYSVNVAASGSYTLDARVASPGQGGTFHVEMDGTNVTGPLTIPDTGGWQGWTTVSKTVTLSGGAHIMRVVFDSNGGSGAVGNLNWVRLTVASASGSSPYGGTAWAVPGRVEAENFDNGGEGVAYHDTSAGNSGGQYRSTDVDIEGTADAGGGYNVGWIQASEWLNYSVNVAASGSYTLDARVASPGQGGTFHVEMDGTNVTGPLTIPDTGGWQAWTTVSKTVTLSGGAHVLRVVFDSNGASGAVGNLNWVQLSSGTGSKPYGGIPWAVPGRVEAENFDNGGEGVAYHDTSAGNSGGLYRSTDVDIEATTDTGGGYDVGWMTAGEWLKYTVSVQQAGTYTLRARVAANGPGGTFHVEVNGTAITGPLTIPNTGGWQSWVDLTASVSLSAGVQTLRLVEDANGSTGVFGNVNYIELTLS